MSVFDNMIDMLHDKIEKKDPSTEVPAKSKRALKRQAASISPIFHALMTMQRILMRSQRSSSAIWLVGWIPSLALGAALESKRPPPKERPFQLDLQCN